jgi:hypothetical protein
VSALCAAVWDVRHADGSSAVDLGERFESIVIGNVMEPVADPVALLCFAVRHLGAGGRILARTLNSFIYLNFMRAAKQGIMIENAEQVAWFTPGNVLEMAERAGPR